MSLLPVFYVNADCLSRLGIEFARWQKWIGITRKVLRLDIFYPRNRVQSEENRSSSGDGERALRELQKTRTAVR